MKYLRPFLIVALICLSVRSQLRAEELLSLAYENDAVIDLALGNPLQAEGVLVMGTGPSAYVELDGNSAIRVEHAPHFSFGPADTLWVEAWMEPVRFLKGGAILSKGTGSNYRFQVDGKGQLGLSYYSQGGWQTIVSDEPLVTDTWQHAAVLFDSSSGTQLLLIDGRVVAKKEHAMPFQSQDELPVTVGANLNPTTGEVSFGWVGALGPVKLSKGNPRSVPLEAEVGTQAFGVTNPF